MPQMNKGGKYIFGKSLIWGNGRIKLSAEMLATLRLTPGMELLSIHSSDSAFTMGAKGPLLEKEKLFAGEIELYA